MLVNLDELIEHRTLLDDERELVGGKRGPDRAVVRIAPEVEGLASA